LNTFRFSKNPSKTAEFFSLWLAKEEDPLVKGAVEAALNEIRRIVSQASSETET